MSDTQHSSSAEVTLRALESFGGGLQLGVDHSPVNFGRYRILRMLDQRGASFAFVAHDSILDRRVVLELLDPAASERSGEVERALASISHPNLARIYEAGEIDGLGFVASELVVGPSLAHWLPGKRWFEILTLFMEIGEGLAAAHEHGLVHERFSLDSVIVGLDGRARVVDFVRGLPLDATSAPEQLRGEAVDARADQFAYCVSLWQALFDLPPFAGPTHEGRLAAMLAGEIDHSGLGPSIPAGVVAALRRGLSADPAQRFSDMPALLRALGPAPQRRASERLALWLGLESEGGEAGSSRITWLLAAALLTLMVGGFALGRVLGGAEESTVPSSVAAPVEPEEIVGVPERLCAGLVLSAAYDDDPEPILRTFRALTRASAEQADELSEVERQRLWRTSFGVAELMADRSRWALVQGQREQGRAWADAADEVFVWLLDEIGEEASAGRERAITLQARALLLRSLGRFEADPKLLAKAHALEIESTPAWARDQSGPASPLSSPDK